MTATAHQTTAAFLARQTWYCGPSYSYALVGVMTFRRDRADDGDMTYRCRVTGSHLPWELVDVT